MQKTHQISIAADDCDYAVMVCVHTLPRGPKREALLAHDERTTIPNSHDALAAGQGGSRLKLIGSALIGIGHVVEACRAPESQEGLGDRWRAHCTEHTLAGAS